MLLSTLPLFSLVSYWHVRIPFIDRNDGLSSTLPFWQRRGLPTSAVRNEPVFGLHSEKASIMPMPAPELRRRLIVTDDDPTKDTSVDEAKVVHRENVGGPGKTCWFKNADELTEHPMICFAKGVSPDCRDYTLQKLIHEMDNCILQIKASDDKTDRIEKLSEMDRQHRETKAIFVIDKKNSKKHSVGRTVFFVTVGQMKHSQISLKSVPITPFHKSQEIVGIFVHKKDPSACIMMLTFGSRRRRAPKRRPNHLEEYPALS